MAYKNRELGIITQRQYQYLLSIMNKNNMRISEPLDNILPIPEPTMFNDAVTLLLEANVFTAASLVDELSVYGLPMNYDEIERLLDLPVDKLKPNINYNNSITIKLK